MPCPGRKCIVPLPRMAIRGSTAGLQAAFRVFLPTVWVHVELRRFALLPRVLHRIVHAMRVYLAARTRPEAPQGK